MLFLTLEEVLKIHRDQIDRYGGTPEMRDEGLIKSALAMPMAQFGGEYLHSTPAEMAGAYLYHLACNHACVCRWEQTRGRRGRACFSDAQWVSL